VDSLDDLGHGIDVGLGRDVVGLVIIVGADVDDNDISSGLFLEVPRLWVVYSTC
jgi:hypothetical protein